MEVKSVKAVRGFYYGGKLVKAGETITVPSIFAVEVITANKAVEVVAEVKPEIETVPLGEHHKELMKSASGNIIPKSRGGKKDVK